MPANYHIDNKTKLIFTTWEGEAHDNDFIMAIKEYQKDIQNHPDYITYNEVVNLSNVSKIKITTEGIKTLSHIASSTDKGRSNRKLAIIVNSTFAFGLARMYEAYRSFSKKSQKEIRIFKNEISALEWINK